MDHSLIFFFILGPPEQPVSAKQFILPKDNPIQASFPAYVPKLMQAATKEPIVLYIRS